MANEKRLIDANALLREIDGIHQRHYANSRYQFIHDFFLAMFRKIKNAPTVDAVEVVHGRWDRENTFAYANLYRCSNCEQTTLKTYNYCPNCGAKMDGDGNA